MRQTIPGDAAVLDSGATSLERTADLLLELARELERIAEDDVSIGEAADTIRGRTREMGADLRKVEPRYSGTSSAVHEFAVTLVDVQARHGQAVAEHDDAQAKVAYYRHEIAEIDRRRLRMLMTIPDPEEEADLARRRAMLASELGHHESVMYSAEAHALAAEQDWDEAGERAADRIRPALEALNDSFLERVGAALEDFGGFLVAVGDWIAKILDTVITALVLLVVAVIAIVVILTLVLSFLPVLLVFLATGVLTLDLLVESLVGVLLVIIPVVFPAVYLLLAKEAITPTPEVVPVHPTGGTLVKRSGVNHYEYLFDNNGALDAEGGTESTVVEVVQVMNPDGTPAHDENGNPIWRVTLPSTQDWQMPGGDQGGVNDLGSNLALIMTPDQKAAYERAVLQAMHDAGIGPNDSVMLIGWSQGGILAGAIASDPHSGFNVRAITVAGAPIDHMDIPDDVAVLAFQHDGDHVPRLDGTPPHQGPNWVTVNTASTGSGYPHAAEKYGDTARSTTSGSHVDPEVARIVDEQAMFFSETEYSHKFSFQEKDLAIA